MPRLRRRSGFVRRRRLRSSRRRGSRFGRRIIRRPFRSHRRRFSRRSRGGRLRTGFGVNPHSFAKYGRRIRISQRSRIRAAMRMSLPNVQIDNTGHTIFAAQNSAEYNVVTWADPATLINLADFCGNVPLNNFTGAVPTAGNPLTPNLNTGQFVLASVSASLHFKNQTTNGCRIDIWEMYPKQTMDTEYTSLITDVVRNGFTSRTLVNATSAPNSVINYIAPSAYPNMNPQLMAWFKLRKHKTVALLPGQTFHHTISWHRAMLINMSRVFSGQKSIKGITKHLLVRVLGDTAWDPTDAIACYSPARVDYNVETRYTTYWSPGLVAKTGLLTDNQSATNHLTFAINPVTGQENLGVTGSLTGGTGTITSVIGNVDTVH